MSITEFLLTPQIFSLIRPFFHNGFKGRKKIIKKLKITSKEKIIDIACGVGTFSTLIPGEYTGVDINPEFVKFAKRKYKKNFLVADATNLKMFNDKFFDKALVIDCLHHLSDDKVKKILEETSRITKNKILIIDVSEQTRNNFIGSFLLKMDVGKFTRNSSKLRNIISQFINIEKEIVFSSGFYKEIAFIGSPRN
jgi:ubiquinone/menaquinone biosynthesis C-methylase UbiE